LSYFKLTLTQGKTFSLAKLTPQATKINFKWGCTIIQTLHAVKVHQMIPFRTLGNLEMQEYDDISEFDLKCNCDCLLGYETSSGIA